LYDHAIMLKVGIIGASGFTGVELLRLISQHPQMEVAWTSADTQAGQKASELYPSLGLDYADLDLTEFDPAQVDGVDLVFLGLPHEASMELVPQLVERVGCVVDLSAAFRLRDTAAYPTYYGFEHQQGGLLADAVYGLPEKYRAELRSARLIATPGCYVTAATLAMEPLVRAGVVGEQPIIVDAASGVSGAGRAATHTNSFSTVNENFTAYGLISHRHTPEMEQEIGSSVLFTPHLAPMNRGILATCYSRPVGTDLPTTADLLDILKDRYVDEPFVMVTNTSPSTKATLGSNAVHITARSDPRTGYMIVIAALDNLTKGASGGALQSANLALGLPETAGLSRVGMMP
jgi:N-acetyl-gamma-glutamyl-phosphate reductase